MKKENFVSMILGTIGGILFALGMCMCLLPEWDRRGLGVTLGSIGVIVVLIMLVVRRKMLHKPAIKISAKLMGRIVYSTIAILVLGIGMCAAMKQLKERYFMVLICFLPI